MRKWKEVQKVLHGKGIRRRHSSGYGSKANAFTAKNSSARSSARRIRTLPLLAGHFECNRDLSPLDDSRCNQTVTSLALPREELRERCHTCDRWCVYRANRAES